MFPFFTHNRTGGHDTRKRQDGRHITVALASVFRLLTETLHNVAWVQSQSIFFG